MRQDVNDRGNDGRNRFQNIILLAIRTEPSTADALAAEQAMMEQGAGCHIIRGRRWVFAQS